MERLINWQAGSNNVTALERLPDGFVRHLINLDAGDLLSLRTGYEKLLEGQAIRGLFSLGHDLMVIDGEQLICYDTLTGASGMLANVPASGSVAGTVFNDQLYLMLENKALRIKDRTVKPWTINNPRPTLSLGEGQLSKGRYKIALTASGEEGEESGADIYLMDVPDNGAIVIYCDTNAAVYVSACNAETLYYQGSIEGQKIIINLESDTKRLTTGHLYPFPYVDSLVSYHGVIIGSLDNVVYFSQPFMPHLIRADRGFLQYPAPISVIAPVADGVYIVADKTYFVSNLETDDITQLKVSDTDAVKGSYTPLPDGRAAWFCRYGQVIAGMGGEIATPNKGLYAPDIKTQGASTYTEHNGRSMIINALDKQANPNNGLAIGDYWQLEIGDEVYTC